MESGDRLPLPVLTCTLEQGASSFATADKRPWGRLETQRKDALVRLDCIAQVRAAQDRTMVAVALPRACLRCLPSQGRACLCCCLRACLRRQRKGSPTPLFGAKQAEMARKHPLIARA